MQIQYTDNLESLRADQLEAFLVDWPNHLDSVAVTAGPLTRRRGACRLGIP
jgi:hypothetical protein